MQTTYVDFIRHGEPEGGQVFRGHTDHRLTVLGHQQFKQRIATTEQNWQVILSSPLLRCFESAEILAKTLDIPLVVEPDLAEIHFGDWENRAVDEVMAEHNISQLWQNPMDFCAPQGEHTQALQQRCVAVWQDIVERYAGQRVLVVTHGGVMRVLAHHLLELTENSINKLSLPYAALMRFKLIETTYQGEAQQWLNLLNLDGSDL